MRLQQAHYRLLETTLLLGRTHDDRKILGEILKAIRYVMNVNVSSLLLLDPAADELYFHAFEGGSSGVRQIRLKMGEGIAGWVAKRRKPLMVNNVSQDGRFTQRVDKATGFLTKNILCVPLIAEGKVLGVIEAINKRRGNFTAADQKIFTAFAAQAAVALENARLYSLAFLDALTGVYGRRYFEACMANEFARAQRYKNDFSMAILDMDRFKRINDTFGHVAGDHVLAETGRLIKGAARTSDIVARFGGEEFALILPNTSMEDAALALERIRLSVQEHIYVFAKEKIQMTLSVGISGFNACFPSTSVEMIELADKLLYTAKQNGGNQLLCAPRRSGK